MVTDAQVPTRFVALWVIAAQTKLKITQGR